MSFWLKKSSGNLLAAQFMHVNEDFRHASVHCSYYACLQLIKHVCHFEMEPPVRLPRDATVHKDVVPLIFHALGAVDTVSATYFNNNFGDLRRFRDQSDYDNVEVTHDRAKKAFEIATRICENIKENLFDE